MASLGFAPWATATVAVALLLLAHPKVLCDSLFAEEGTQPSPVEGTELPAPALYHGSPPGQGQPSYRHHGFLPPQGHYEPHPHGNIPPGRYSFPPAHAYYPHGGHHGYQLPHGRFPAGPHGLPPRGYHEQHFLPPGAKNHPHVKSQDED